MTPRDGAVRICLHGALRAGPLFQQEACTAFRVTPSLAMRSGMFAWWPSTTPFGLALGPDLPWEDEPGPGNLGFSVGGIRTRLVATHACMITRMPSSAPRGEPSTSMRRSPTRSRSKIAPPRLRLPASVPIIFGAGPLGQWAITRSLNDGCF